MRWDCSRHCRGNAYSTVANHVWKCRRQYFGFFQALVVVGAIINGLLLEVVQHLLPRSCHTRFCVAHRSGRISVDGAKITLSIYEWITQLKILRQMHQRWIDNVFTVRMVIARSVTGNMSAFSMLPVCAQAEVIHCH